MMNLLKKEISGLHEAAYLLGLFAFLSQLLAVVRDRLLTYYFGAGSELDIYYASFKVPDTIFVMAASVVAVSILVPIIVDKSEKGKAEEKAFINSIFSFFSVFMIVVSIASFFLMPYILNIIYSGMAPEKLESVIKLSRILLLQPFILGFANLFGSIVQVHKQFFVYALGPILYNFGIILGIVFFYKQLGLSGLIFGVILGAILQLVIQIPAIRHNDLVPRFSKFDMAVIRQVINQSLPRTISLGVSTVAVLFLTAFAARMTEGSISIFTLAFNLQGVPLAIIGMSYSLAAFPALSRMYTRNDIAGFIAEIKSSLGHIIFWSWPVIILFVVLRAQIVRVILGSSSKFTWSDTKLTAAVFAIMALSVLGQAVVLLITRAFYAAKNTYIPLVVNSFTAIMTIVFSMIFIDVYDICPGFKDWITHVMRVDGTAGSEVLMLSIGFSLSLLMDGIILWIIFAKKFKSNYSNLSKTFIQSLFSSLVIGLVTYFSLNIFSRMFDINTVMGVFLHGFVSGMMGIIVGISVLKILKNKEIEEIWETLHRKFWKAKVDIGGPDTLQ